MAGGPGRAGLIIFMGVAVWSAAIGCAHGVIEPTAEAKRTCAAMNAASTLGGEPAPASPLARGQALYCLELYAASLAVLGREVAGRPMTGVLDAVTQLDPPPAGRDRVPALRWLVYLHRRFPGWQAITDAVGVAPRADRDSAELGDVRDDLNAIAARFAFEQGRFGEAAELARQIPPASPLHIEAALLAGEAQLRAGAPEAAQAAFEEARRAAVASGDAKHDRDRDRAVVSLSRIHRAAGRLAAAAWQYDLIPLASPLWATAVLEGARVSLQMKDDKRAFARLAPLVARLNDVPYETGAEAVALAAQIALQQSRIRDADRISEQFQQVYPVLYAEARKLLKEEPEALLAAALVFRAGGAPPPIGAEPARLLLADEEVARGIDEVDELRRELGRYQQLTGAWRSSPQGRDVGAELALRSRLAEREAARILQRRLQASTDGLRDQIKQSIGIEYQLLQSHRYDEERGPLE